MLISSVLFITIIMVGVGIGVDSLSRFIMKVIIGVQKVAIQVSDSFLL